MTEILERVANESQALGLEINMEKTKLMVIDRSNTMHMGNLQNRLEVVDNFIYLGSLIINKEGCEEEIRRRITLARTSMSNLTKIWKDRHITKNIKKTLVNTLVFSVFSYGSESWTIKSGDRQRIDAFEMWCWRRMLRIPWPAHRTNVSILNELRIKDRLSTVCRRGILRYFGHISRGDHNNLEELIEGRIEVRRLRGRSPSRWVDQIKEITGKSLQANTRETKDRQCWRRKILQYS